MRRRPATALAVATASGLLFVVWTFLTFRTALLAGLDDTSLSPGVDLTTGWGQLTAACSFLFDPWVAYVVLLFLAGWAWRRRLRNLAWSLLLAVPLAALSDPLLKWEFQRSRPATRIDLVTAGGWAYPSGHMTGVSVLVILALVAAITTRRRGAIRLLAGLGAVLWLAVAYNRWALRAHYLTDIVAGGLWGTFVAAIAVLVSRVHVVAPWAGRRRLDVRPRVAVIVNPTKVPDWEVLRHLVDGVARQHGWRRPRWTETTETDPGLNAARTAAALGVDLVLVAGGDGTVRAVAQGLAGTSVTFAILPAGTGNLLARNLAIPLDTDDALAVAFDGVAQPLDLVEIRADGGEPQGCVVMAGMGLDAIIMSETNRDLKRAVGPAAYFLSALAAISRGSFLLTTTLEGEPPVTREARLAMLANVGQLQAGILLIPDARPDDGLVDLLVADARGAAGWAEMAGKVMTRASAIGGLERWQGRRAVLETEEPLPYQVDGDTLGTCRRLEASVLPGALTVMVPR